MPLADSIFNMYERTGRGISQGLGSIGETRRENARLRYEGRRAGLEEPALRLQSEQAQQKLDFMNAPFRIDSLVPKGKDVNTTMAWLTDDYIGDIAKTFDAEIDPEQGVLMKNGKVVTNRMAAPFMNNIVASVISAKQDPGHAFNSRMEQLQSKVNEGTATEQDITNLKKMTDLKNNPIEFENWIKGQHEQNIMTNANRRAYFKQMGADPFVLDASDARSVRKINNITSNQQAREKERSELAKEERQFKREKELIKLRSKLKNLGNSDKKRKQAEDTYLKLLGLRIRAEKGDSDIQALANMVLTLQGGKATNINKDDSKKDVVDKLNVLINEYEKALGYNIQNEEQQTQPELKEEQSTTEEMQQIIIPDDLKNIPNITPENIKHTMRNKGMTYEEVINWLRENK